MRFGIIKLEEHNEAFVAGFQGGEVVILVESATAGHVHAQRYPSRTRNKVEGDIPKDAVIEVENPAVYLQELHNQSHLQWQMLEEASAQREKLAKECDNNAALYRSALRLLELSIVNQQ